ncbi:MAG: hypothetical protein EPN85_07035 [Bacteroidetes bacterium]|nr:MAG: hypothetical protein EPN85_07035 [Bacteroidota bacterium]
MKRNTQIRSDMTGYEAPVHFSIPHPKTGCMTVSRFLADGTKEMIGCVFREQNNEDGPEEYISYDNYGNKICSATASWPEIENEFELLAKRIDKIEYFKTINKFYEEMENREIEVENIRQRIKGKEKIKQLTR